MQHDFVRPFAYSISVSFPYFSSICAFAGTVSERERGAKNLLYGKSYLQFLFCTVSAIKPASQPGLVVTNRTFVHFQSCPQQLYPLVMILRYILLDSLFFVRGIYNATFMFLCIFRMMFRMCTNGLKLPATKCLQASLDGVCL